MPLLRHCNTGRENTFLDILCTENQYRQDVFPISNYHNRKKFPSYARCSENHNNTCAENRKIRGLKFDTP